MADHYARMTQEQEERENKEARECFAEGSARRASELRRHSRRVQMRMPDYVMCDVEKKAAIDRREFRGREWPGASALSHVRM